MKPATVAPAPMPKLPATRLSAKAAARCSGQISLTTNVRLAVPAAPSPAPPTIEQAKPCQGRSTKAKPAYPTALAKLPATTSALGEYRSSSAPVGGVTTADDPMVAARTSPAVDVEKPRVWCR